MIEKSVYFDRLGFAVQYFIGQNAKDNFDILDLASPDDWWFHVLNKPSCHVIAKLPGKLDRHDLRFVKKQGAVLCRQHSSSSIADSSKEKIMYAKVKYVQKTDIVGQVHVEHYSLI